MLAPMLYVDAFYPMCFRWVVGACKSRLFGRHVSCECCRRQAVEADKPHFVNPKFVLERVLLCIIVVYVNQLRLCLLLLILYE